MTTSGRRRSDLHRSPHPLLEPFCFLEGTQGGGRSVEACVPRGQRRGGAAALQEFDQGAWGTQVSAIAQSWRRNWEAVTPLFAFHPEVRKIVYTTHAIESLNASVRKALRNKGHFPSDQAATKLISLALRHITEIPPAEFEQMYCQQK